MSRFFARHSGVFRNRPKRSHGFGRALALCAVLVTALAPLPAMPGAEDAVARAARRHLLDEAQRAELAEPDVRVQVLGDGKPSSCPAPVDVEVLDARNPARMRFAARCAGDGTRQEFVVRAQVSALVVVATAPIGAGRPIAPHEIALERRAVTSIGEAVSDPENVIELSSRRALRAGRPIERRLLVEPILVRRGAAVRIQARNGPVEVTAAGESLAAGRRDDVVRVRNTGTGSVIQARVIGHNVVEPAGIPFASPSQSMP